MEKGISPIEMILNLSWEEESPKILELATFTALSFNLADEINEGKYGEEDVGKLFTIMRERSFSRTLLNLFKKYKGLVSKQPETINAIKNMQMLITAFLSTDKTNKNKELIKDYLDLAIDILNFYDYHMLRVIRALFGKNISDMDAEEQEKIRTMLHIPSKEAFHNLIIPVVDGLLVRKNNE